MAEEDVAATTEEVAEPKTPFLEAAGNDRENLVLSLAASILFDGEAEFTVCCTRQTSLAQAFPSSLPNPL